MNRPAILLSSVLAMAASVLATSPLAARDSLGVFSNWAAFRDASPQRCYAIAKPVRGADTGPFASVSTWPRQSVRGQVHLRLSRAVAASGDVRLVVGNRSFALAANGRNAWAQNAQMDARIVAEMRTAARMRVTGRDNAGRRFTDRYDLTGAATAIDAAVVGCAARTRR
ncbi:hypothetical protein [Qipengyuania nanhaisediminis]|uniref:hypothetical protein n=1 Tax=Qipengyuania nanhaisediminis TaxID=604088 RepID=UPI0038B238ED